MIFVSYSYADEKWRKRFETISKPLSRFEKIQFWSDRDVKAGEWEPQIEKALKNCIAAVLLVSDNFLASDYIIAGVSAPEWHRCMKMPRAVCG